MSSDKKFLKEQERVKRSLCRIMRGSTLTLIEQADAIERASDDVAGDLKTRSKKRSRKTPVPVIFTPDHPFPFGHK